MLFASVQFIFFFLPLVFFIYLALRKISYQNIFLLLASILFYVWGEAWHVTILAATVIISYFLAIKIQAANDKSKRKFFVILGITLNLGILIGVKYLGFLTQITNAVLNILGIGLQLPVKNPHLPLGVSFFVFHAISYLIDVYRAHTVAEKRFSIVSLYFFLFPHQIAGPIVRYEHFSVNTDDRNIQMNDLYEGVERFIQGLVKKVLIANSVAKPADEVFALAANDLSSPLAWLGITCYTLQIYFDFSGYSDMAIGLARMFGYHFHENFNFPYRAHSITNFWRRWHISLSTWFRDYLYIPLGGNRCSPLRNYFNLGLVFLLCGLWHGASWVFLIWGLWHGVFLIIERLGMEKLISKNSVVAHIWTLLIVMLGWVFFRASDLSHAGIFISKMFSFSYEGESYHAVIDNLGILGVIFGIIFASGHAADIAKNILSRIPGVYEFTLITLFLLSISRIAGSTFNPFIYFRF